MTKLFCLKFAFISLILLLSKGSIAQSNSEFGNGFKAGYKTGYCAGDLSCIAPFPPLPPLPGLGSSRTYMDGYNTGFSQGQLDKSKKQTNNNVNASQQKNGLTPSPEQIQQSRLTELQIEEQRFRTLELRRQLNEEYELRAIKNPELEMNSSQDVRLKVVTDSRKIKFNYFIPTTFKEITLSGNPNEKVLKSYNRNYSNGTSLFLKVSQYPSFFKDSVNTYFESEKNRPNIIFGFKPVDSVDKFEIKNVFGYGTFYEMGIESGDVIMVVDTIPVKNIDEFVKATAGLKVNDSISLMVLRDGKLFQAKGQCLERYGKHFSEFNVSGYSTKMYSYMNEVESYGEKTYFLVVRNFIQIEDGVLEFAFSIRKENSTPQMTEEFWKNYKSLFQQLLNSTTIE